MKINSLLLSALAAGLALIPSTHGQTATNLGLVGVEWVSGDLFDQLGPNVDSLGGIGSSAFVDQNSILRNGDAVNGFTYKWHPLWRSGSRLQWRHAGLSSAPAHVQLRHHAVL